MRRPTPWAWPLLLIVGAGSAFASEGVDEIVKLEEAGVSDDVQLAYVQNSSIAYDPTSQEIERLEQAGVSASVIVAMIERGEKADARSAAASQGELRNAASSPEETVMTRGAEPQPQVPPPVYNDDVSVSAAVSYVPPGGEMDVSFFYGSLSPYGNWHRIDGYGYAWRPNVAITVTDWQPYCNDGHWVWTDHGWYWESSYPWGWAAFHYGRWHRHHHHGWVWIPGTTWGPAWVDWRHSDEYYGWAPLPPEAHFRAGVGITFGSGDVRVGLGFGLASDAYTFVPAGAFLERDYHRHRVPRRNVTNVYNRTTVVNNTYVYNDNRVINRGIPVDNVRRRTRANIETVQVTTMSASEGQALTRAERREQNRIEVFRPVVREGARQEPAAAAATYRTRAAERREARAAQRLDASKERRERVQDRRENARERQEEAVQDRREDASERRQEAAQERREDAAQRESAQQERLDQLKRQREKKREGVQERREDASERRQEAAQERREDAAQRESAQQERLDQLKRQREKKREGVQERREDASERRQEAAQERRQEAARRQSERQGAQQQRQQQAERRRQEAVQKSQEREAGDVQGKPVQRKGQRR
ncbi:MAG: hypothetical protein AMXMBFR7_29800 [Planctomycetota bacterium]